MELEFMKQLGVRFKIDVRSVLFFGISAVVFLEYAFFKNRLVIFAVTVTARNKTLTQCIDGFKAHTVQSHTGGKHGCVIFCTCVQLGHGRDKTAERYASPEVTD